MHQTYEPTQWTKTHKEGKRTSAAGNVETKDRRTPWKTEVITKRN